MKKNKNISNVTRVLVSVLIIFTALLFVPATGLAGDMVITGVIDGPLTGGVPKAIELYVLNDIADLSHCGVGSANNGGGSDGQEFTFPTQSAMAGDFLYVASEESGFESFFGFSPNFTSNSASINGDDAIELFCDNTVVDVFGEINESGSGQRWQYTDGWAYRKSGTGPDGSLFDASNWLFSGPDALDNTTDNDSAGTPFPLGSYSIESEASTETECPEPTHFIHDLQGKDLISVAVGQTVTIAGVVVGDFQNNDMSDSGNLNGFYVQEEDVDADNDPLTSEAIFIYAPGAADVSIGDLVHVTGKVAEYETSDGASSQTQITNISDIQICGESALPNVTMVRLPVNDPTDFERYEGMRIAFPQGLTISDHYYFGRYGQIVLALPPKGKDRLYQPTHVVKPGTQAGNLQQQNDLRRITLDDGRTTQNPDPAIHPNGDIFDLDNMFRTGDRVVNVTGVVDDTYGEYRIHSTAGAAYTQKNPRPLSLPQIKGRLKVASFNVLNYFTTFGSRGAENSEEFERQRVKIISAIAQINADIVGLIEIENNAAEAILDLIDGINEKLGEDAYSYIDTGVIGSDEIKLALIYKAAKVAPVGSYKILDSSIDAEFIDTKNRPALIQTFQEISSGQRFTIAHNHFKSKGSSCEDIGDLDQEDGQGNCNETRTKAAQALIDYLATDPTGSNDSDYLIIGDLNSYAMEDPINVMQKAGYKNMVKAFSGKYSYSYVYDGQFGELDHALASTSLAKQISGAYVWHINSDEATILDYTTGYKKEAQDALFEENAFRSSDHDPVIVGLTLKGKTQ